MATDEETGESGNSLAVAVCWMRDDSFVYSFVFLTATSVMQPTLSGMTDAAADARKGE